MQRDGAWRRDAVLIFALAVIALLAFHQIEAFERVAMFAAVHETWQLDEWLTLLMVMPLALTFFSWRRLGESRRELARRVEAEERANEMALHDPLTGLPNRRFVTQEISAALKLANRSPIALLLLDLDRFKAINDLYGHKAGDDLLVQVAMRLRDVAGGESVVARLGGDEFVVMLRSAPSDEALISRVSDISAAFKEPFNLDGVTSSVSASIGVTRIDDAGLEVGTALSQADAAMYNCKGAGRNRYCFFEKGMEQAALYRAEVEAKLAVAIAEGRIVPHYQPLVQLSTGKVIGYEVLARWRLEDGGCRLPSDFIEVAEASGLIGDLFYSLLDQAAHAVSQWPPEMFFAINLSAVQFNDEWLVERVLQILVQHGVAPGRMEIELTENALVEDFDRARDLVKAFREQGIRVVLDDFGTGYSSLRHLNEMSFDKVKIDRSFIEDLDTNEGSQTIVRAVTSLAHHLGLRVTVEGIETARNADTVTGYGCDIGQGFLYGRPEPNAELPREPAQEDKTGAVPEWQRKVGF